MMRLAIPGFSGSLEYDGEANSDSRLERIHLGLREHWGGLGATLAEFAVSNATDHLRNALKTQARKRRPEVAASREMRLGSMIEREINRGLAVICAYDKVILSGHAPYKIVRNDRFEYAVRSFLRENGNYTSNKELRRRSRLALQFIDAVIYEIVLASSRGVIRSGERETARTQRSSPARERKPALTAIGATFAEGGTWFSTPDGQPRISAFAAQGGAELALSWPRSQDERALLKYFEDLETEAPSAPRKISCFFNDRAVIEEIGGVDAETETLITSDLQAEWSNGAMSVVLEFVPETGRHNAQAQTLWFTRQPSGVQLESGISLDRRFLRANAERIGGLIKETHTDALVSQSLQTGYAQKVLVAIAARVDQNT